MNQMTEDELRSLIERECGPVQRINDMHWAVAVARVAMAAERERWRQSLERVTDALAARLGTNADEWRDVKEAREVLNGA